MSSSPDPRVQISGDAAGKTAADGPAGSRRTLRPPSPFHCRCRFILDLTNALTLEPRRHRCQQHCKERRAHLRPAGRRGASHLAL